MAIPRFFVLVSDPFSKDDSQAESRLFFFAAGVVYQSSMDIGACLAGFGGTGKISIAGYCRLRQTKHRRSGQSIQNIIDAECTPADK